MSRNSSVRTIVKTKFLLIRQAKTSGKAWMTFPADRTSAARTGARDGPCAGLARGDSKGVRAHSHPFGLGRHNATLCYKSPRRGVEQPAYKWCSKGICSTLPKMRLPRRACSPPRNDRQRTARPGGAIQHTKCTQKEKAFARRPDSRGRLTDFLRSIGTYL